MDILLCGILLNAILMSWIQSLEQYSAHYGSIILLSGILLSGNLMSGIMKIGILLSDSLQEDILLSGIQCL